MLLGFLLIFAPESLSLAPMPHRTDGEATGGWVLMLFVVAPTLLMTAAYMLGVGLRLFLWRNRRKTTGRTEGS